MGPSTREILLGISLDAAIPLWIDQIQREAWPWPEIERVAHEAGQVVAEKGDVLQFGDKKKKGAAASAFNHLARGLACLAFCPGGVTFLGRHWEAKP